MTRVLASTARCPYCTARLPKAPTKSHNCPSCKNTFYIQQGQDGNAYIITAEELEPYQNNSYIDKRIVKAGSSSPWTSIKQQSFHTYKTKLSLKNIFLISVLLLSLGGMAFMIYMAIDATIRQSDTFGVAREAFDIINEYRQTNGVAPLLWDDGLEQLALEHSKYMDDTNDFSTGDFGLGNYGQNLLQSSGAVFGGGAFPTGDNIVSEWKNGTGNYNILNSGWENGTADYNLLNSGWKYGAIGIVGNYATYIASAE